MPPTKKTKPHPVRLEDVAGNVVLRDAAGRRLGTATLNAKNKNTIQQTWRQVLRGATGNGAAILQVILDIAQGVPYEVELPSGERTQPQVPNSATRLQAAMFLFEAMNGKAVTQDKVIEAEAAAHQHEALIALSDEELEREVKRLLYEKSLKEGEVKDAELLPPPKPEQP